MRKGIFFLVLLLAFSAGGCRDVAKGKGAAQSQVAVFHQQFNDQNLEAIVAAAHRDFLKKSSKAEVIELLSTVRGKLGRVTNSDTSSWNVNSGRVTNVTLVQKTTFEVGSGTETFIFRISKGKASLLGYNIRSNDLITK